MPTKRPIAIRRREPGLGPSPDYSRAIYCDPASHDFCVWLIMAETMRRYHNAPGPLKVRLGLIEGQLGLYDFGPISIVASAQGATHYAQQHGGKRSYSDRMIEHVLSPAIEMIGAVREPDLYHPFVGVEDYVEYDYHIGQLVDAGLQGHLLPQWRPPAWAFQEVDEFLAGTRPVVITLRETVNQPERNSRLGEWLRFAGELDRPVLFLRDTEKANETLPFPTWPRASENAYVRAAHYQRAFVNMMVCNGPNTWCIFSDAPYLIFKELVPELPGWEHGQPSGWRKFDRMDVGDQYPWANRRQRLTWTDDIYPHIKAAYVRFAGDNP